MFNAPWPETGPLRDDLAHFVGVDLGTYILRVVIADINGRIVYKKHMETELFQGRERVLKKTMGAIREAIEKSDIPRGSIKGIGIRHSGSYQHGAWDRSLCSAARPASGVEERSPASFG